jgi:hypothetical protein
MSLNSQPQSDSLRNEKWRGARRWLYLQWLQIRGNAKYDALIRGGGIVSSFFLGLIAWLRQAPGWQVLLWFLLLLFALLIFRFFVTRKMLWIAKALLLFALVLPIYAIASHKAVPSRNAQAESTLTNSSSNSALGKGKIISLTGSSPVNSPIINGNGNSVVISTNVAGPYQESPPNLEVLFVTDEIAPSPVDRVDYHFEVENKGKLRADNVRWKLHGEGGLHQRIATEFSDTIGGGDKISILVPPWFWEANDFASDWELEIDFEYSIDGKSRYLTSFYTFKMQRQSTKPGYLLPEKRKTIPRDEPQNVDLGKAFLGLDDYAGFMYFSFGGPMPRGSAGNGIRQIYLDPDSRSVTFDFRPLNGRKIALTNYLGSTNGFRLIDQRPKVYHVVSFGWDKFGAFVNIDGNVVADPEDYWKTNLMLAEKNLLK